MGSKLLLGFGHNKVVLNVLLGDLMHKSTMAIGISHKIFMFNHFYRFDLLKILVQSAGFEEVKTG